VIFCTDALLKHWFHCLFLFFLTGNWYQKPKQQQSGTTRPATSSTTTKEQQAGTYHKKDSSWLLGSKKTLVLFMNS
jgi:hypothetical protein